MLRLLFIIVLLLFPTSAQAQAPDRVPSVTSGQVLWGQNCAPCHGLAGQGDGPTAQAIENPLPDFTNPETARLLVPRENFEIIKNGRIENMMPPWGNTLSDEQIWDLTALVWHLSTTPEDIAAGQTIYSEQCTACHGEGGTGEGPQAPATISDFTNVTQMIAVSQADLQASFRAGEPHTQFASLSDTEVGQALDYIRTFSFALPQRNGVLSGQVTNGTTNEPAPNLDLTLHIIQGDSEVETLTGQVDASGHYTFEGLPTDPSFLFLVEGEYQGVTYESQDFASFVHDGEQTTLDLNVYEPATTNADAIDVTQLHYIVAFAPQGVTVLQIYVVGNSSNQAYIGDEAGRTFSFALPPDAENVIFQGDLSKTRFVENESGYADTKPIIPGPEGQTIAISYDIPYNNEDNLTIETPLSAPVDSLNLLLEERGISLTSEQLEFVETRDIQGGTFSIFSGSQLKQGDTFTFQLSNLNTLPLAPPSEAGAAATTVAQSGVDQNLLRWLIIALGGLAVIGAGIIYPLRRSQNTPQPATTAEHTRQKLLLLLARLDEMFEVGQLDETVYRQTRAQYKAQLAAMMEDRGHL